MLKSQMESDKNSKTSWKTPIYPFLKNLTCYCIQKGHYSFHGQNG
jgi:hypothetical protein